MSCSLLSEIRKLQLRILEWPFFLCSHYTLANFLYKLANFLLLKLSDLREDLDHVVLRQVLLVARHGTDGIEVVDDLHVFWSGGLVFPLSATDGCFRAEHPVLLVRSPLPLSLSVVPAIPQLRRHGSQEDKESC